MIFDFNADFDRSLPFKNKKEISYSFRHCNLSANDLDFLENLLVLPHLKSLDVSFNDQLFSVIPELVHFVSLNHSVEEFHVQGIQVTKQMRLKLNEVLESNKSKNSSCSGSTEFHEEYSSEDKKCCWQCLLASEKKRFTEEIEKIRAETVLINEFKKEAINLVESLELKLQSKENEMQLLKADWEKERRRFQPESDSRDLELSSCKIEIASVQKRSEMLESERRAVDLELEQLRDDWREQNDLLKRLEQEIQQARNEFNKKEQEISSVRAQMKVQSETHQTKIFNLTETLSETENKYKLKLSEKDEQIRALVKEVADVEVLDKDRIGNIKVLKKDISVWMSRFSDLENEHERLLNEHDRCGDAVKFEKEAKEKMKSELNKFKENYNYMEEQLDACKRANKLLVKEIQLKLNYFNEAVKESLLISN
jgi:hypothetical protein